MIKQVLRSRSLKDLPEGAVAQCDSGLDHDLTLRGVEESRLNETVFVV
jgi:hypothetical protein